MARSVTPMHGLKKGDRPSFRTATHGLVYVSLGRDFTPGGGGRRVFEITNLAGEVIRTVPVERAATLMALLPGDELA